MKSFLRWGATLGLVGSTLLSACLGGNLKALALPEATILEKLQPIPVFTIADEKGIPLVAVLENQKVTGIFISQEDAKVFLEKLKKDNPEVGNKVTVQLVSLGAVYKLQEAMEKEGLVISYVAAQPQIDFATQLLKAKGKEYEGGVPLFVARAGEDQGYLTISQNNQPVVPFFFDKDAANNLLEQFKKQQPDLASTAKIDVIPLEAVLAQLQSSDDEMLKKIFLIPSQESINFIRANLSQQNSQNNTNQTKPKP
jgi:hypothetical protein